MINAIVTEQAVYMGDHSQDVTRAVAPLPEETVEDFAQRVLSVQTGYPVRPEANYDKYVTIRLVDEREAP